ncbi:MAG: HrcA family transcriptional regulator [Helicobacter sp.]|nr:HrcA family transcriptional regulator [Helicobacter sp.]
MAYDREFLLDKIILSYLQKPKPIGSENLKGEFGLKMSSAAIRNHFNFLSKNGILAKQHASSGRIPTHLAMKNYWQKKLDPKYSTIKLKSAKEIEQACKKHHVYVLISTKNDKKLVEVKELSDFLVLIFEAKDGDKDMVVSPFKPQLQRFLQDLIGLNLSDIKSIANQLMASDLLRQIRDLRTFETTHFELKELAFLIADQRFDLFSDCKNGDIFSHLQNGAHFYPHFTEGYMGLVQNVEFAKTSAKMLCVGSLYANFGEFFTQIKE